MKYFMYLHVLVLFLVCVAVVFYRKSLSKSEENEYVSQGFSISVSQTSIIGRRRSQEDKIVILPNFFRGYSLFAVFDGHGGSLVSEYLRKHIESHFTEKIRSILESETNSDEAIDESQMKEMISTIYEEINLELKNLKPENDDEVTEEKDHLGGEAGVSQFEYMGSTSAILLIAPSNKMIVSWNGDSRVVGISFSEEKTSYTHETLTVDHNLSSNDDELERLEKDYEEGKCPVFRQRLYGTLAVSRSFGDFGFHPCLLVDPEIKMIESAKDYKYFFLASDGLFDRIDGEDLEKLILSYDMVDKFEFENYSSLLAQEAYDRFSRDNISVILLKIEEKNVSGSFRT